MSDEAKQAVIAGAVADLIGLERSIEQFVDQLSARVESDGDSAARLRTWRELAVSHRDALHAYLGNVGAADRQGSQGAPATHLGDGTDSIVGVLRQAHAVFSFAITGYAVLCEMAFRLYEPPLRELAPKHLRDYVEASQGILQAIAAAVAADLRQAGLECRCACPMCSIGACGCVATVTRTINRAWRETTPAEEMDGLLLQEPRSGSQFAQAGLRADDRLLAVDDRSVRSIDDVQGAIRAHALGEELRVLIHRGEEAPQEIRVSHVGDYPGTTSSR